ALAEQMRRGGGDDEEREQRDDRQIGKVAGVDEPVVIDAHHDPLGDLPRSDLGRELLLNLAAERGPDAGVALTASFRGLWGEISHPAVTLNIQPGARVAAAVPLLGKR